MEGMVVGEGGRTREDMDGETVVGDGDMARWIYSWGKWLLLCVRLKFVKDLIEKYPLFSELNVTEKLNVT
jgi:hypothetical protein